MTNNTKGEWTKNTNVDKFYEIIRWNNPIDYYGIMNNTDLKGPYIKNENIMYVNKNEKYYVKIRLIFDDGG